LTLALVLTLLYAAAGWAETFTVTNTSNSGAESLRAAITEANQRTGAEEIFFADGVGGTITLGSELPKVTEPEGLAKDGGKVAVRGNHTVSLFWVAPNAKLDVSSGFREVTF
jgi:hypothetical protein